VPFLVGGHMQNYLLLARTNTGVIEEKVNICCTLTEATHILKSIMATKASLVRGEIIDGNRPWIMDFRAKPIWSIGYDEQ
jgi:hypothetical protein